MGRKPFVHMVENHAYHDMGAASIILCQPMANACLPGCAKPTERNEEPAGGAGAEARPRCSGLVAQLKARTDMKTQSGPQSSEKAACIPPRALGEPVQVVQPQQHLTSPALPVFGIEQNYELGRTLGRGKYGKVKEAVHRQTGQRVAIKIINKTLVNHNADDAELVREVRFTSSIDHPNVQRVHDVVEDLDTLYIVLDLAAGGDLYDYIASQGKLSENSARQMFKQLILGLEACHAAGVAHRDIKPENILLRKVPTSDDFESHDSIILSDFGLSNSFEVDDDGNESLLKTPCGSTKYAAPELMTGRRTSYTPTTIDVWSAAVVLFVSVEGRFPFSDATDRCELFRTLQNNAYEFPAGLGSNLTSLLAGMFCIDPKQRWTLSQIKSSKWWNESDDIDWEESDQSECERAAEVPHWLTEDAAYSSPPPASFDPSQIELFGTPDPKVPSFFDLAELAACMESDSPSCNACPLLW